VEKQLQIQEKELSDEFEKKVSLTQNMHQEELRIQRHTCSRSGEGSKVNNSEISTYNEKIEEQV
jgi:hypothetical protein